ncbi:SubName: Full=Uncharacterized protein {ECO:0000313/EMBL:CCA69571.1} [Serendipita indica DSM 11827]|uniref:Uncharacterized protein n=1 Tax=Serendipita indica (strain DSM 11827) TaxID=1109443 RepID=G4TE24_SERID|nr:SubName: Full=Uncharacterized protein {ECO:0000313/EMBL:CCA69571.1} [Serendipita indica DSM 11827]CCA69571.1 hypothetical protein PIIN_03510 [Serendipita indica DSM 11827]
MPQHMGSAPFYMHQPVAGSSQYPINYLGVPQSQPTVQQQQATPAEASPAQPTASTSSTRRPAARKHRWEDKKIDALSDPQVKEHMRKALARLADEEAPGVKLEDEATEMLLHIANDFLNEITNLSFRVAEHRAGENPTDDDIVVRAEDMELYLARLGLRIPATPRPRRVPQPGETERVVDRVLAPTPPLAQSRGRRNTGPTQQDSESSEELTEEEDEEEDEDEDEDDEDSDADKPRESKRLKARAEAEKVKRGRGRGTRGRPRK